LFSLFDMERMTGRLAVQTPNDHATIWVRDGQLVDIEPILEGETPRKRLVTVLGWREGGFQLYVEPVERPDRIGSTTIALMLDLARETDEANRPPP
jgi:hypothetical protein